MDKKIRYNPNCAMCQGKGFYIVGNTSGTQSTAHNCDCHVFYDIKENSQDLDTDLNDMKTAEEKAKECIDNLIDSLSLEVNHEESNYDAGQVHALSDYGKEIYKVGFLEGQSNPKIKQLEWSFHGLYYNVKTEVGHYMILQGDEQCMENFNSCTLTHNGNLIADFNSVAEAKTAAQADFERRVRECLE